LGLVFVVVTVGLVASWNRWGRTVVTRPLYRIALENIQLTPPPPWVRANVAAEVYRDSALHELTSFHKDLTIRVYQAFELHAWIAKVKRVSKHPPARLEIDVEYRRPVALVEVPRGVLPDGEWGLIAVDREAVVLPSRDFMQDDVEKYLWLNIPGIPPCGLAGTQWGDSRVAGAAQIAELLDDSWREWNLFRIQLSGNTDATWRRGPPIYEIETRGHKRIIWGCAPGQGAADEPPAAVKLNRLRSLAASTGGFDAAAQSAWDLRSP
jgi:hypothetical protein